MEPNSLLSSPGPIPISSPPCSIQGHIGSLGPIDDSLGPINSPGTLTGSSGRTRDHWEGNNLRIPYTQTHCYDRHIIRKGATKESLVISTNFKNSLGLGKKAARRPDSRGAAVEGNCG